MNCIKTERIGNLNCEQTKKQQKKNNKKTKQMTIFFFFFCKEKKNNKLNKMNYFSVVLQNNSFVDVDTGRRIKYASNPTSKQNELF